MSISGVGKGILHHDLPGKIGYSAGKHEEECRHGHDAETSDLDQDQKDGLPDVISITYYHRSLFRFLTISQIVEG